MSKYDDTALWRKGQANRGTQNTLAATMEQSIGRRPNKTGSNKICCYHHATWSGFTSFRRTSSTGRYRGLTHIFPSLAVSRYSSHSVPVCRGLLLGLFPCILACQANLSISHPHSYNVPRPSQMYSFSHFIDDNYT